MFQSSVNSIFDTFRLSKEEYEELDKKFGKLCHFIYWQFQRKNSRNNYVEDLDDIQQELRASLIYAGCYYKRQIYLENCFEIAKKHIKDSFLYHLVIELENLWKRRTHHGANKQKFGGYQEQLLESIIQTNITQEIQPSKNKPLQLDKKFSTYCKAIVWNRQKNLGKKITRERSIRSGIVSLSEFEFLGSE